MLRPPFSNGCGVAWGLKATRVATTASGWTGRGIRIAILDSGVDASHPDLEDRVTVCRSFAPAASVQDCMGHGTHCAGTAVGFMDRHGVRYGAAPHADLYPARVFDDNGRTETGMVMSAIEWALSMDCHIILLSLGACNAPPSDEFEAAGRRALDAGGLIVAAAGNGRSRRVARPANASSILAVGAVDNWLRIARFSPMPTPALGRGVDILAPGVRIYSTSRGGGYSMRDGTSMAAAHVAGIAALWAEAEGVRGAALWDRLVVNAQRLCTAGESTVGLATAPDRSSPPSSTAASAH